MEPNYNNMQLLKRRMFAMRNGIVCDTLRKAGSPFKVIFGVNLPQLSEIASEMPHTKEFAEEVWANSTTRESTLIAPMLMPAHDFSIDDAKRWIEEAPAYETIDVLCLKLLRKQPYAFELATTLAENDEIKPRYAGLRLMCNLAPSHPAEAAEMGKKEACRGDARTLPLAKILESYEGIESNTD